MAPVVASEANILRNVPGGPLHNEEREPGEEMPQAAVGSSGSVSLPMLLLVLVPLAGIIAILLREILRRDSSEAG